MGLTKTLPSGKKRQRLLEHTLDAEASSWEDSLIGESASFSERRSTNTFMNDLGMNAQDRDAVYAVFGNKFPSYITLATNTGRPIAETIRAAVNIAYSELEPAPEPTFLRLQPGVRDIDYDKSGNPRVHFDGGHPAQDIIEGYARLLETDRFE